MMVDSTGVNLAGTAKPDGKSQSSDSSGREEPRSTKMLEAKENAKVPEVSDAATNSGKTEETPNSDKSPGRTRSKSNQRWMKLRTTVQLSGAISSTNQKTKPSLKREDSFLKRFSTRQIPETQETVDTGDETEALGGSQMQNEVNRRRRKRRKEMSKSVVNPDENFYFYWLMTVTVCVLYNLWTLIVRQSFPELQEAASAFWYSGDGFADVVFACDIVVQFRTGYLEQGLMVYNSKKLASHYLKSRAFILDVLSLLPLDFLQLNFGVNPILRFPRFLKIYRVYNYYYMVESRTVYPNLWRVVNLIHILLILAHWFGCFYYLLSEAEGFRGDWVYPYRPGDYATLTRKYLGSLYWSTLTLTTIGDLPTPETNAESRGRSKAMTPSGQSDGIPRRGHKSRLLQFNSNYGYLFTIISYLIGVFIFATIVGQVGNVITNRNANRLEFERLLDGAKTYMRHHKVPGGMKRRVLRWYDYSWSRGRIQGGGDINTALGLLPDKLKTELALHVNLSVLKKVTIFQECQPEFLHDLVLKMKAYIFTPGDLICRKGEVAREMFIIADGILDVISETGRVLTTMKAGDFFGEIGILNLDGLNKRTADVRSVGYSELFSLSREDVLTAMKDYPEAQEILQSLGRKRLMEAKNASKMHKTQVKQAKDHDSSGESDTAGKRIVEKLRSDVKGLKNALRRSRRDTRSKETSERSGENLGRKTHSKKQSILRRMSHVQSSDEYEVNNEVDQSPIGAGLPLLQRLKLLKEKQDKEWEEKEINKLKIRGGNQRKGEETTDAETGIGLPYTEKLRPPKQKEVKDSTNPVSGSLVVSSTVRTQVTGVRFDKSVSAPKSPSSPRESENKVVGTKANKEEGESGRISLKEKLKMLHASQVKEKFLLSRPHPEADINGSPNFASETKIETSINVPVTIESDISVPKLVKNTSEVPKSKIAWRLLKNSSITRSKLKTEGNDSVRKVSKKGVYLSKSDTVLEKQKTSETDEGKRSRSISPSDDSNPGEKDSQKYAKERKSYSAPKVEEGCWKIPKKKIKKYNSISDLSPEYSGLPFVKKLKILNERQKLEELEKELLVRSVSLDVPEHVTAKRSGVLVRSRSEASTMEFENADGNLQTGSEARWEEDKSLKERFTTKTEPQFKFRKISHSERNDRSWIHSEDSVTSQESNETLERRHLKSILKKLSAEGSKSEDDQIWKNSRGASTSKLMRAPTVEGYAARHKKLTKSVTFDSDALPGPANPVLPEPPEEKENQGKSFSSTSPAAILTLQLSNLSMIPIAGSKRTEKKEETEGAKEEKDADENRANMKMPVSKATEHSQTDEQKFRRSDRGQENFLMPYSLQELIEKNFRMLPFIKSLDDDYFTEIKGGIFQVLQPLLEEVQNKFQSHFNSLQFEVEKRDEIILQLHSKVQELEGNNLKQAEQKNERKIHEGNTDCSRIETDKTKGPLQRGDSEDIQGTCSPATGIINACKPSPERTNNIMITSHKDDLHSDTSESTSDYLSNVIGYEDEDPFEMMDKSCLLTPCEAVPRLHVRDFTKSPEQPGTANVELTEFQRSFRSNYFKRKRHRMEFHLIRNFSLDESESEANPKVRAGVHNHDQKHSEAPSKGKFKNRVAQLQRTFSCSQDKTADFVALDIDDSSNSSDAENIHNRDWEVQMLVEELGKKDPDWKTEEDKWISETEVEPSPDVRKLQEEVDTLKQVVCDGDLTALTCSELDILETIIEAKDQKISQLAKSNSLDNNDKGGKQMHVRTSISDNKLRKCERKKKPSLRQKIGHALSFDFHDIDSPKAKSHENVKQKSFSLRKQKSISYSPREHHSLYNLWHTSSRLRHRVLEDSDRGIKNLVGSLSPANAGASLPALPLTASGFVPHDENLRTSLPILSSKERHSNFCERLTSSLGSSTEETHLDGDFRQSSDSVFEEVEEPEEMSRGESQPPGTPSTSGLIRPNDCCPSNSLNNFIRSVGQKVKQVMSGDLDPSKNQVPTISKLCDEPFVTKISSEELDVRAASSEVADPAEVSDSFEYDSKTDPPDL